MSTQNRIAAATIAAAMTFAGSAYADLVPLDADAQNGGHEGNIGPFLQPVDAEGNLTSVLITARSMIDKELPFELLAAGSPGSIYVNDEGLGVQTLDGSGSKGISGGGGHQNEEIIFGFTESMIAGSIKIGFADFKPGNQLDKDDDTLVFIGFADGSRTMLDEFEYMDAFSFSQDDNEVGVLDFSRIDPDLLDQDASIDFVVVRETHDHMVVNGLGFAPVPGPGALALLGLAGLSGSRSRRRSA